MINLMKRVTHSIMISLINQKKVTKKTKKKNKKKYKCI